METGRHGLKRELKLWDLVPMQVILIVWLGWTGFGLRRLSFGFWQSFFSTCRSRRW